MLSINDYFIEKDGNFLLNNINLYLNNGKIVSLFGHENSGKTILLKAICKEIPVSSGEIFFNNSSKTWICSIGSSIKISEINNISFDGPHYRRER